MCVPPTNRQIVIILCYYHIGNPFYPPLKLYVIAILNRVHRLTVSSHNIERR